jgi:hypothetical protein
MGTEWMGSSDIIVQKIQRETGRGPDAAARLLQQLEALDPSLRPALINWWKREAVDMDMAVSGWTIRKLIEKGACAHVVEAFTWLNALQHDPAETRAILESNMIRSIVRFEGPN